MIGEKHKIVIACAILLGVVLGPAAYVLIEMKRINFDEKKQLAAAFQASANITPQSQEVYMLSIGTFGKLAIPFLLRIFSAEDESAWQGPAVALEMMGDSAVEEISRIALRRDLSVKQRRNAIKALAKISGNSSLDTLMKILMDTRELYVIRNQVAVMLPRFETPKLIEPLFGLLGEERPEQSGVFYKSIVEALLSASDRIGATRNPEQAGYLKEKISGYLANTGVSAIRAVAIKFAADLRAKEFLPTLENLAKSDPVDFVRKEAASAVAKLNLISGS